MSNPNFRLDDSALIVSWYKSKFSQIKVLYVKNLPENITHDELKELFERHGTISKVVLPLAKRGQENSRYGFVEFAERASAMRVLNSKDEHKICVVEYSLAKPPKTDMPPKTATAPTYPTGIEYGWVGAPYGYLGAGYDGTRLVQPLIYGGVGVVMMPMRLPDGRLIYIPQQPGMQPHQGSYSGGRHGSNHRHGHGRGESYTRGRRGSDRWHGHGRYNPYYSL